MNEDLPRSVALEGASDQTGKGAASKHRDQSNLTMWWRAFKPWSSSDSVGTRCSGLNCCVQKVSESGFVGKT